MPENQDRISDTVWITRENLSGIFNIASETAFSSTTSPANTEWAFGSASDFENLTFTNWQGWHGGSTNVPPSVVGRDADWWLVATTPSGVFHYDLASASWLPGLVASFQGPLFNQPSF